MYQISIQSVNSFESYRVYRQATQTDRQTPSQKSFFLTQGVSKRGDFMKNGVTIHLNNLKNDKQLKIRNKCFLIEFFKQTHKIFIFSSMVLIRCMN